jgi:methylenetetrahydrofolate reductase (NADPH)
MAKICDLLAAGRTFSFEFFPPRTDEEQARLVRTLRELEPLDPSFVSVTYRGGRWSRDRTRDLVAGMLKTTTLNPMAHLTCVVHTRLELAEILIELRRAGVENLLALGGDPPPAGEEGIAELRFASELVELARAIGGFSIGVAAHPEVHPRSPSRVVDRHHLAHKLRLADFAITQMLFRLDDYERMVDELSALGVDKPVIPGIMPITNIRLITKMAELSGSAVPAEVVARFDGVEEPDEVRRIGLEVATELCRALLDAGVPGLHFYTMNFSRATREIYENLGLGPRASSVA